MATKLHDAVLSVGERVHPLMGPIFSSRPSSTEVGQHCALCLEEMPSDTAIIDKNGQTRFVCVTHELMLSKGIASNTDIVAEYAAYVFEHILFTAPRPGWMPLPLYRALAKRAEKKARLLAIFAVLGMATPLTYATPEI